MRNITPLKETGRQTFKRWYIIAVLPFIMTMLSGAGDPKPMRAGLLLTFDDRNMLHWEKAIPLFEKYDAHVTFFVDHFHNLSPDQIKALHALKAAGHAIACHGVHHIRSVEFVDKHSMNEFIDTEIKPAISAMRQAGFNPSAFAYPFSNHNAETDKELLKYFKHLRSGIRIKGSIAGTDAAFVSMKNIGCRKRFDGISFHPKSVTDDLFIQATRALDRIKERNEMLTFYAHDIRTADENGPRHFITPDALEGLLKYAQSNGIPLYSYEEIP